MQETISPAFAPNLKGRVSHQLKLLRVIDRLKEATDYTFYKGEYNTQRDSLTPKHVVPHELLPRYMTYGLESLSGIENWVVETLKHQLKVKKDGPVIATDLGGMAGLSWVRIARHFEKEIMENRMAFVVTNLVYDPNKQSHLEGSGLSKPEKEFIKKHGHLVNFIVAKPSQLKKSQITLFNGKKIPLEGNVDFLYENRSATSWSNVPDIDILRIAKLLDDSGIYMVHRKVDDELYDDKLVDPSVSDFEQIQRRKGINIAHDRLVKEFGLSMITEVEDGPMKGEEMNYKVFKAKNASVIYA